MKIKFLAVLALLVCAHAGAVGFPSIDPGPAGQVEKSNGTSKLQPATGVDLGAKFTGSNCAGAVPLLRTGDCSSVREVQLLPENSAIAFGDSHFGLGWNSQAVPSSAGSLVVSGGIATVNFGSNTYTSIGNYVLLFNANDQLMRDSLNGAFVPVLTTPSSSIFTVSATVNGVTMADGDYSNTNGGGWSMAPFTSGTDSSFIRAINYAAGNPLRFVAEYGVVGASTGQMTLMVAKALAGPHFGVVVMDGGSNDFDNGANYSVQVANQRMQAAYQNMVVMTNQFLAAGKRVILVISPPGYSGGASPAISNAAMLTYRRKLVQFAQTTSGVTVIDLFKDTVDGTSAVGSTKALFNNGNDFIHLSSYANYQIGVMEAATLTSVVPYVNSEPISILDDAQTFSTGVSTVDAWATGQSYTVPFLVLNNGYLYQLTHAGSGATSGAGPIFSSGTQTTSDGYTWAFAGVDSRNIIAHGLMDGSGGTNNGSTNFGSGGTAASPTGSPQVPTSWYLGAPTSCKGISLSQQALSRTGGNSPLFGYGWTANLSFSAAGNCIFGSADEITGFIPDHWYVGCMTVTAIADFSNIRDLWLTITPYMINPGGVGSFYQVFVNRPGNNATTLPMKSGDVRPICSDPFYVSPGANFDLGTYTMALQIDSSAAGVANFQMSNATIHQIGSPYR